LTRHRYTDNFQLERVLTCELLTNDSLVGIQLLAETVRMTAAPGQDYLRILNLRTRVWKEKAQNVALARAGGRARGYSRKREGNGADWG